MNWAHKLRLRFRALFQKEKLDARMDEEMRSHVEMQTQENIEAGMKPEEARYAALRQFGWVRLKTQCNTQRTPYAGQVVEMPELSGNRSIKHCCQIICHDHRVCSKPRIDRFFGMKSNKYAARVVAAVQVARNHCEHHLRNSCFQIVCLHNQSGAFLEGGHVRIWEPNQNDIAPFKICHTAPSREPTSPPPRRLTCREVRPIPPWSIADLPRARGRLLKQVLRADRKSAHSDARPLPYICQELSYTCTQVTEPNSPGQARMAPNENRSDRSAATRMGKER